MGWLMGQTFKMLGQTLWWTFIDPICVVFIGKNSNWQLYENRCCSVCPSHVKIWQLLCPSCFTLQIHSSSKNIPQFYGSRKLWNVHLFKLSNGYKTISAGKSWVPFGWFSWFYKMFTSFLATAECTQCMIITEVIHINLNTVSMIPGNRMEFKYRTGQMKNTIVFYLRMKKASYIFSLAMILVCLSDTISQFIS